MVDPLVSIVMGSRSDLDVMNEAAGILRQFDVSHETRVISANRTPKRRTSSASLQDREGCNSS